MFFTGIYVNLQSWKLLDIYWTNVVVQVVGVFFRLKVRVSNGDMQLSWIQALRVSCEIYARVYLRWHLWRSLYSILVMYQLSHSISYTIHQPVSLMYLLRVPLLTWIKFNPSMDKRIWCPVKCGMELFIHCQTATVEVWKWLSNFISHFTGYMVTYPCWDQR